MAARALIDRTIVVVQLYSVTLLETVVEVFQELIQGRCSYGTYRVPGPDGRAMPVPQLRLQGAWLEDAGFAIGTPVKVHVSRGRLVIEAIESERVPQAEVLRVLGALVADEGLSKRDFDALVRRLKQDRID